MDKKAVSLFFKGFLKTVFRSFFLTGHTTVFETKMWLSTHSWDPNHQNFVDHQIFFYQISAVSFCWENKSLIGQSTKKFSVKTGFEELEKK